MGKIKWSRHVNHEDEDMNIHPGCMWGLVHALGYHSWHSRVKKKSLSSISDGSRHIRSNNTFKEHLVGQDTSELETLLDDNESHEFLADKGTRKSKGSNKRSLKAKIKALIAEEVHKEKKRPKQKKSGSINQPTEHYLNEKRSNRKHPIILVPVNVENGGTGSPDKERMNAINAYDTSTDKNALKSQLKDHAELLLEILRESEAGYQNFSRGQLASNKKARLTKSGSYPVSHLSRRTNFKPSKLEDKKNEVWSSAKGERLAGVTRTRSLSNYAKTIFTSLGFLDDNKGNNEELVDAEEGIKQDSTCELFENLNGEYESKSNGNCEIDGCDISKNTMMHRRSSSLNESMDRYTKLFEYSFRKEVNLNPSKSLKLTSEYEVPPSVTFRKIRSLSYSEACSFLPNGVAGDAHFSEWLIKTIEERNSHMRAEVEREGKSICAPKETGCINEKVDKSEVVKTVETVTSLIPKTEKEDNAEVKDHSETIDEAIVFKGNSYEEQEIKCNESIPSDVVQSSEICFEEDISNCAEFQISKGFAVKQNVDVANLAKPDQHSKSYRKENADLFYVRDILKHSGFSSNYFKTSWYSQAQVLNPSVVQELESLWHPHQEQECCLEGFDFCCHHQLLFDLVNEVLVQMYDRSFTYYPKALSCCCRVRSMLENRMIEEVSNNVGTLLRLKPEQESIDAIVDQDLKRDDGWMNLQLESEWLALELEDMIFSDLLEELRGF
ncbi:protein TRM32-like [Lycium barbarum]|uniref:protein TRM32-like n=1 Tax=Lycium barbarum TaxID=112863 RepID=UPI00293EAC71|nr:protein TRM32-like [Lycium barbarum]